MSYKVISDVLSTRQVCNLCSEKVDVSIWRPRSSSSCRWASVATSSSSSCLSFLVQAGLGAYRSTTQNAALSSHPILHSLLALRDLRTVHGNERQSLQTDESHCLPGIAMMPPTHTPKIVQDQHKHSRMRIPNPHDVSVPRRGGDRGL